MSEIPQVGLPPAAVCEVFPFHMVLNRQLGIIQVGRGFNKICSKVKIGDKLSDHFQLVTPEINFNFDSILSQRFTVFFVRNIDSQVVLKGQMLYLESSNPDNIIFLASPSVRDLSSLADMGMTLNDFALHDSVMDFLVLLQTKTNTINDVQKMAIRLKKEVGVRREAEAALKEINEALEQRVASRTLQLQEANEELATEISERKRIGDELESANQELKRWVTKLEQYNHEISLLNVMGDMLQACRAIEETYEVIVDILQQLFPEAVGMFALYDDLTEQFVVVANWGGVAKVGKRIRHDDCWGLRRAKLHVHETDHDDAVCKHLGTTPPSGYLCAPLLVQGKTLGLIHLQAKESASVDAYQRLTRSESRQQLIHTASDHVGLAIANLRLQESLRMQSIRDPLTGLYNRRHMEASLERETARAKRQQSAVGIIMLDVDHFKQFNDTQGHEAGDIMLAELGEFLLRHLRTEDVACRYGGEEFVLILPGAVIANTSQRAEELRLEVEQHLRAEHQGKKLPQVTISVGAAAYPDCGESGKAVVAAADAALYQSKREGRNRTTIAPPSSVVQPSTS